MRFIRFIDPAGATHYGLRQAEDRAELLAGDPYSGLTPTGESATIATLLAPVQPVNIFGIGLNYKAHATTRPMPTRPGPTCRPARWCS
jgi:hypothetical protein